MTIVMIGHAHVERRARGSQPTLSPFTWFVERDGRERAVGANIDGQRKVISRHATAQMAASAERDLNESANRSSEEWN